MEVAESLRHNHLTKVRENVLSESEATIKSLGSLFLELDDLADINIAQLMIFIMQSNCLNHREYLSVPMVLQRPIPLYTD